MPSDPYKPNRFVRLIINNITSMISAKGIIMAAIRAIPFGMCTTIIVAANELGLNNLLKAVYAKRNIRRILTESVRLFK
jgi:hypothetical protein